MEVGNVFNTAEKAMMRDSESVRETAHDIASDEKLDNLENNMVDLIEAQRSFEANAVVISTADEMLDTILSIR